jgi:hypothetical protein
MKSDVYEPMMDEKRSLPFSEFIRTEYKAICYPEWNEVCKQRNGGKSYQRIPYQDQEKNWQVKYDKVPEDVIPFERADNVIQARTQKYKQWLNFDEPSDLTYVGSKREFLDNTLHVRVEDLIPQNQTHTSKNLQYKYIGEPLRERCVPLNDEGSFKEHVIYTKFDPVWDEKQVFDPIDERKKMLAMFSKEDINFVLSQLDLDFEKSIGYDYSYIHEILNAK